MGLLNMNTAAIDVVVVVAVSEDGLVKSSVWEEFRQCHTRAFCLAKIDAVAMRHEV